MSQLLKAIDFACTKHMRQRRKNGLAAPYVNHPIGTAWIASDLGGITDEDILKACVLHDTLEDTKTTYDELVREFGVSTADIVAEVSDDKSLAKSERKRAQVVHMQTMSNEARLVKMCDKLYNMRDLKVLPPDWSLERIQGYFTWARLVLKPAKGLNKAIEEALENEIFTSTFMYEGTEYPCCPETIDECHVFPD